MPQKIGWNQHNFKIEGNESRMIHQLVAHLPDVPIHPEEAYMLKVEADSVFPEGLFPGFDERPRGKTYYCLL